MVSLLSLGRRRGRSPQMDVDVFPFPDARPTTAASFGPDLEVRRLPQSKPASCRTIDRNRFVLFQSCARCGSTYVDANGLTPEGVPARDCGH